jgi:predicted transglutaminase-like cysteine proteinase
MNAAGVPAAGALVPRPFAMVSTLFNTAGCRLSRFESGRRGVRPPAVPRFTHLFIVALLLMNCVFAREGLLSEATINHFSGRYGGSAVERLRAWERMMLAHRDGAEHGILEQVNAFFNRIPWLSDDEHWGKRDYWATPLEMLGTNGGDCEDYSIAKYITLVKMGVDPTRLRITYVRAPRLRQTHMVLAYYPRPDAEPLILDNLDQQIRPASQRRDLIPVYSFNASGLWATSSSGASKRMSSVSRLNAWREVARRMRLEGVEDNG